MSGDQTTSFIIGDGSLAIQCGGILLERDQHVAGVVTDDATVRSWAESHGISTAAPDADLEAFLGQEPFDYLFSVVNLRMLPDAVIGLPRRMAINFHDGPLPRYAGINSTSWALIAGEESHGVTWHEMTTRADSGRILAQQCFDIGEGETAFSLNAKCFDAGMGSFRALADALIADTLEPREQDLSERSYFGRFRRPSGASLIDFDRAAADVAAFVSAHDLGVAYPNPFALAKVAVADGPPVIVGSVSVSREASRRPPGTIVGRGESGARIATRDHDVVLSGLRSADGRALSERDLREVGLIEAAVVVGPSSPVGEALTRFVDDTVRAEAAWRDRLAAVEPIGLPRSLEGAEPGPDPEVEVAVPAPLAGDDRRIAAALACFVGRAVGVGAYDIGFRSAALDAASSELDQWVVATIPVRVDPAPEASVDDGLSAVAEAMARAEIEGPFLRDTLVRCPVLERVPTGPGGVDLPVVVRVDDADRPPGARLALTVVDDCVRVIGDGATVSGDGLEALGAQLRTWLGAAADDTARPLAGVPILDDETRDRLLSTWNDTAREYDRGETIHTLFGAQAGRHPDNPAVTFRGRTLTYGELEIRSNRLARHLRQCGVRPGTLVGVFMERSNDIAVATLAIMKAGGAYVPLDPEYPSERLAFMIDDANVTAIVTQERVRHRVEAGERTVVSIDGDAAAIARSDAEPLPTLSGPADLAYVIYTSGSTGRPKGVMVEHGNVVNFFAGMDDTLGFDPGHDAPGVWLAVTSLNFDISVLELFWTLARGFHVVIHAEDHHPGGFVPVHGGVGVEMGLFYFSSDESAGHEDKYALLLEGARFADRNGFNAVWTPERHFHAFGGLFPNPSVTSAALATITENVQLRAGSCVSPLHSPIRIAEEWSVVDNLSKGRVGLSFAAGWQPNDFAIRPEHYGRRKERMFEDIETVRRLWRGETIPFVDGTGETVDVRVLPRPYSEELEIWVTAAGNPDTFAAAGQVGANLLTHLLGQTLEQLAEKIGIYRTARQRAGHPGRGTVSLMLHTYVGTDDDEVRELVREPMKNYLRSAVGLVKAAAWSFPTFEKTATMEDGSFGIDHLSEEEFDALLDHAFERYYETAGLFGSADTCLRIVDQIKGIDVDDIACLIDFGVPSDAAMQALPRLASVFRESNAGVGIRGSERDFSIPALIARHAVSHFQCTPSMASMLVVDEGVAASLRGLEKLLVGGEALPAPMARQLDALTDGDVINMYGPTETTIWSTTWTVSGAFDAVPIGAPIANTTIRILDPSGQLVAPGALGELCIGGDGVVRGYLDRPGLTAERFVPDAFGDDRLYRTGDLASWRTDGVLEFHGRLDHQVKLRGHRIELGEIEARLVEHPDVRAAAVIIREDTPGDRRIVGYLVPGAERPGDDALRAHLAAGMPEYMVPTAFVALDALPATPNRKIDRKALPAPSRASGGTGVDYVAPSSKLERAITEIWCEVLSLERVGTQENFFDLGGHSLLTIQVHGRLKSVLDRPLTLVDLFRYPTVSALAQYLEAGDSDRALDRTAARAGARRDALARRRTARQRRR